MPIYRTYDARPEKMDGKIMSCPAQGDGEGGKGENKECTPGRAQESEHCKMERTTQWKTNV